MAELKNKEEEEEVFELEDLVVDEVSLVDEPAVSDALITVIKSKEDDVEKASGYISPKDIIAALQAMMEHESDEKKKKRYQLLIANLKSLWGLKKAEDEEEDECEEEDEKGKAKKEIDKAGKTISRANATKLKTIAAQLLELAKQLASIAGVGYEKPGYGYYYKPYEYKPYESKESKSSDKSFTELLTEATNLLMNGSLTKSEIESIETALTNLIANQN